MSDVSRALLLPDVHAPSDGMLKTLALYWREIVVPDYAERLARASIRSLHQITAEFSVNPGSGRTELELAIQDPEQFLRSILGHPRLYRQLLGEFWTSRVDAARSFAQILDDLPVGAD